MLLLMNSMSIHSAPYSSLLPLKSNIKTAAIEDWLIKVNGKYPGFPKMVSFPKLNSSSRI